MKKLLLTLALIPFGICLAQPANDDPCNATVLTVGAACSNTAGTNLNATASEIAAPGIVGPGCANYQGGDVWYSLTVPSSGNIIVTTSDAGGITDTGIATYSGTCGTITAPLTCGDDGAIGLFSEIIETGLTPGSTIYVRVWSFSNLNPGNFNICAVYPIFLPIQLLDMYGHAYEKMNQLSWSTASEENNDYFVIEKSTNGSDFKAIGTVKGNGNSTSRHTYSFNDFDINLAIVYYKLFQINFDGTKMEIGTIEMKRQASNVTCHPNPSKDELNFTFNTTYDGNIIINYINTQGEILTEKVEMDVNNSFKSSLFHDLLSGLYYITIIENGSIIETMKIIKK